MSARFLHGCLPLALVAMVVFAWILPAGAAPVFNPGTWSIYDSSGPAYPGGGSNGPSDPTYAADKMIDGSLSTFAVLVDDTLTGSSTGTIPDYAAAPVTGHVVFDLGQTAFVSALELVSKNESGTYNPRDVRFFYFADDNPADNPIIDDIENDSDIVAMHVGSSTTYTFPGVNSNNAHTVTFSSPVAKRYLGMRVDSSYESAGTHFNFQAAEIKLDAVDPPPALDLATAVWHFANLADSAGGESYLNTPVGTGAVGVAAATAIAARNSDNLVFDAGGGGKTATSNHGWIGIHPFPDGRSDELTPRLNTSLSVFARVRWTGQFNFQPQPTGTDNDNDVDDILRFGAVSYKDRDWYALQLYAGGDNTSEAQAQFVFTEDTLNDAGPETTLLHDSTLSLDTWYDITGVFNSDEQTATLYVFDPQTGREVGTAQTITGLSFSSLETAAGNLLMMVSPNHGEGPNPNAQMDLAAVWHAALTPEQVAYLSFVPEPGTAVMLLAALGLFLLRRRRG